MLDEQEGGVEVVVRTQETPQRRASRTTLGLGTRFGLRSRADVVAAWERGRAPELARHCAPPHSFSASSLALRSLHSTTAPQASHIRSHNDAFAPARLLVIVPQAMSQAQSRRLPSCRTTSSRVESRHDDKASTCSAPWPSRQQVGRPS